jgi:hypothetical protein
MRATPRPLYVFLAVAAFLTLSAFVPTVRGETAPEPHRQIVKLPAKHKVALWHSAKASEYGGPHERQRVAGPYPSTGVMDKRGWFYFANKSMLFGTKVAFRYKGRTRIGFCADRGPYCGGRVFDLGYPLARALRFDGVGRVQWRRVR